MNKYEREILKGCVEDILNSDDQIDGLTRLLNIVKQMIKHK